MDFLLVKKPTITLKPHFFEQMLQYEEILRKKYGFTLSKDWQSPFFNLEDEVLTNTYLNTLQKGRKSPRASVANLEKAAPKKGSIQWNKKIKTVLPSSVLQHTEIIKSVASNKQFPHDPMTDSQTIQLGESHPDDETKSVFTQKKPFKVILKSKSAKSFEERAYESQQTFDTPGTPSMSVIGNKTAPNELMSVYSAQNIPQRPATMGLETDQKYMRRNNSLAKDVGNKDTDVTVRPFKVKDRPDNSVSRPATDADQERNKSGKTIKTELDKIKDQLNIHYGNTKNIHARIASKSGKSLGDASLATSGFGFTQERMPLNQLISGEDGSSSKDMLKTTKKGPIKPNYKMGFNGPEIVKAARQETKRNMFNINTHGSLGRSNRRSVQSADKQPEEKKSTGPPTHSTIRTIISTLDQRQTTANSSSQAKQKLRPSNFTLT